MLVNSQVPEPHSLTLSLADPAHNSLHKAQHGKHKGPEEIGVRTQLLPLQVF